MRIDVVGTPDCPCDGHDADAIAPLGGRQNGEQLRSVTVPPRGAGTLWQIRTCGFEWPAFSTTANKEFQQVTTEATTPRPNAMALAVRAATKKAAPKKAARKAAPKKAVKKAAPKKAATKKTVTKRAAPKKAATKRVAAKKAVTKRAAPKKAVAKRAAPKRAAKATKVAKVAAKRAAPRRRKVAPAPEPAPEAPTGGTEPTS